MQQIVEHALFTVNEVAIRLGQHPETIRRAIRDGRLAAVRLGPTQRAEYRVPAPSLERYLTGRSPGDLRIPRGQHAHDAADAA